MSATLFIVDDEYIIRDGLLSVAWDNIGIEIIGSAKDGEEAFQKIKCCNPDIVISDIRMPKKDGVWLAENVRKIFPETKFIFLTGYNEFEYAQSGIKFGVSDYLLKPINIEKLFAVVKKAKKEFELNRLKLVEMENYKTSLHKSRFFLKNWFLTSLEENTLETLPDDFKLSGEKFVCITVKFLELQDADHFSLFLLFQKSLSFYKNVIPFFEPNYFTYFLGYPDMEEQKILENVFSDTQALCSYLSENYQGEFCIGIGLITNSISDIIISNNGSVEALKHALYIGTKEIIYIADIETRTQMIEISNILIKAYVNSIKTCDKMLFAQTLSNIFTQLKQMHLNMEEAQWLCLELIIHSFHAIHETAPNMNLPFDKKSIWVSMSQCLTISHLYEVVLNINLKLISKISMQRMDRNHALIESVKKLIDDQYGNKISLESIAAQIYISPGYLSAIFTKEMGITFKDYLISVRVNKAKELLEKSTFKIHEVCEMVGYTDPRYFSDVFKKHIGQTPSQYKTFINSRLKRT